MTPTKDLEALCDEVTKNRRRGRRSLLTPAERRFVRKAFVLRAKLTNKALANRFRVCVRTIAREGNPRPKKKRPAQAVPRGASVLTTKFTHGSSQ